jgi:two-component system response regulator GlrR
MKVDLPDPMTVSAVAPDTLLWKLRPDTRQPVVRHFKLDVLDQGRATETFEGAAERCSIGSHASNEIAIDDPTVSRFHCEIQTDGSRARVRDLDSRNGTVLDGVMVREAYLRSGSVLQLGRVNLCFRPADQTTPLLVSEKTAFGGLVGRSVAMRACFAVLERTAMTDATLLLEGETGTGKSKAARAVHNMSQRGGGPFLTLDCGAVPPNLLESELFGHRRGAFTGALQDRTGVLEEADGGTVFLDEIGELPLELQPKLLKTLEDREIRRVGTNAYKSINVRIIAATNRDLRAEVNAGRFRADLFYRLAVVRVTVPSLRQRPDDIGAIAERLLKDLGATPEMSTSLRTPEFLSKLQVAAWPGNVRELRNHLERCLVFRDALSPTDDPAVALSGAALAHLPYAEARRRALDTFEQEYVHALLDDHGGNVARAADVADLDRASLYRLLRRHRDK